VLLEYFCSVFLRRFFGTFGFGFGWLLVNLDWHQKARGQGVVLELGCCNSGRGCVSLAASDDAGLFLSMFLFFAFFLIIVSKPLLARF